jgi:hypothetical protein
MTRSASDSPAARALRDAGYVKLPGWWVTLEQYQMILWMAEKNKAEIDRIKQAAHSIRSLEDKSSGQ